MPITIDRKRNEEVANQFLENYKKVCEAIQAYETAVESCVKEAENAGTEEQEQTAEIKKNLESFQLIDAFVQDVLKAVIDKADQENAFIKIYQKRVAETREMLANIKKNNQNIKG